MEITTVLALTEAEKEVAIGGVEIGRVLGIGIGVFLTVLVAFWIFQIIAFWKIFTKAGESGWKSIIPIYNSYVQYKITWKPMWFWIIFVVSIIYGATNGIIQGGSTSVIVSVIELITAIAYCVIQIISYVKLSRSFGHGIGFALGLIFLYPMFILILGYGKSEYKGINL